MPYVDGFVLPVPKRKLAAYRKMARKGGKIWMELGALQFRECVADDLRASFGMPFTKLVRLKPGETVMFSYIVFRSRRDRDRINARVMKDPRLDPMMDKMPFDPRRMSYGGFKTLVDF